MLEIIHLRRLDSQWDPCWKCEDVSLQMDQGHDVLSDTIAAVLQTCKVMFVLDPLGARRRLSDYTMYMDFVNLVVDVTVIRVTGLDTLDCLLWSSYTAP